MHAAKKKNAYICMQPPSFSPSHPAISILLPRMLIPISHMQYTYPASPHIPPPNTSTYSHTLPHTHSHTLPLSPSLSLPLPHAHTHATQRTHLHTYHHRTYPKWAPPRSTLTPPDFAFSLAFSLSLFFSIHLSLSPSPSPSPDETVIVAATSNAEAGVESRFPDY